MAPLGADVTVPVSVPHAGAEVQAETGNLNDAMLVDQLNAPVVFRYCVRVPEGALVDGIDGHGAVIAPTVSGVDTICDLLHASAGLDLCLSAQRIQRVSVEAPIDKD